MLAEGFAEVFLDPVHWGIEIIAEMAFFGIEVLILDRLLHRFHPRETHTRGKK